MRLRPTSVLLIVLLVGSWHDALGFECRRRLLTGDEQSTLEAFVFKSVGLTADPHSIRACRNWDVVLVDTLRSPQPDGTERLARLSCWPMRKSWPDRWHCVGDPINGFRADTYPGQSGVWVGIETPTAPQLARHLVALGFGLLAHEGTLESCTGGAGNARALADVRTEITGSAEFILLGRQQDRFWFEGGDIIVYFERDSEDAARIKCWHKQEIVVTD